MKKRDKTNVLKLGAFIWILGSTRGIGISCDMLKARKNPSYGSDTELMYINMFL